MCVERKLECVHVFNGMLSLSRTFVYNLTRTTDQKYRRCSAANGTEWHSPTVASTVIICIVTPAYHAHDTCSRHQRE